MGYIGKPPEQGRYGKLDQISSGFNGSTATFNLTVGSEAVYPVNPQALIISLNGVIQQPGTDYTVSSATITFTTNPASGVGFFGVILGDALDIGTPSDGSVTVAKMAANSVDSAQYVDGSIDLIHMSAESVDSNQYVDGSIDRVHLAADIIDGTKIADDVINSEHYAAASIDNEHLADNAVNSAELAAGSVDTAHIANSQITNALMADDAIGVAELSATGTASSSTFLRGDNAWAAAGGISVKVGSFTKNTADATGTQVITGVGFEPKAVIFFMNISGHDEMSFGFADGTNSGMVADQNGQQTDDYYTNNTRIIQAIQASNVEYNGVLNSLDSGGFTIGWTKYGAKTGLMLINYLAIR